MRFRTFLPSLGTVAVRVSETLLLLGQKKKNPNKYNRFLVVSVTVILTVWSNGSAKCCGSPFGPGCHSREVTTSVYSTVYSLHQISRLKEEGRFSLGCSSAMLHSV